MTSPSPNGRNGQGRFVKGWKGGPGNPYAKRVGSLRSALLDAVTAEDMASIVHALVEKAKTGDVRAIKEVLDRSLGKPVAADLVERLEELEAFADEIEAHNAP